MQLRWVVHSGAEKFGPWSASEIRDQLRMGKIDAFDLVALFSSTELAPIYDVPALFDSYSERTLENELAQMKPPDLKMASGGINAEQPYPEANAWQTQPTAIQEKLSAAKLGQPGGPAPQIHAVIHENSNKIGASSAQVSPDLGAWPKPKNASPPQTNITNLKTKSANGARKYFLRAPGERAKGPFSSRDITLLWYGKKLSPQYTVQKIGGPARINIRKFITFYEQANVSSIAFLRQGHLAPSLKQGFFRWLLIPFLVISILIAGAFLWQKKHPNSTDLLVQPMEPIWKQVKNDVSNTSVNSNKSSTVQPIAPVPEGIKRAKIKIKLPSMAKRPKIKDPSMHYWRPKYAAPAPLPTQLAQPLKPAPERAQSNLVPATNLGSKSMPSRTPAIKQIGANQRTAAPKKPSTPLGPAWSNGANVTLSGYRYNAGALSACTGKCKIPMTGPKGPVIAVFFKDSFAKEFLGNKTALTLGGTIKLDPAGGPPFIYVQTVH